MEVNVLQEVGLSKNESKVYLILLELGLSTANQISAKSKVYRRNVYDSLEKLIEKGLVSEILYSKRRYFKAVHPSRLKDILIEKEKGIDTILPDLVSKFETIKTTEETHIFKGINGLKTVLSDILRERKTLYLLGAKGKWWDPRLKYFLPHFEKKRLELGIKYKSIFDFETKGHPATKLRLQKYKFLPKEFSSPTHIWIYSDKVITLYWGEEPLAIMIKSKKITQGFKKYFQFIWDRC